MTNGQGKRHGQERDRLLACWNSELGFECTVCGEATVLPKGLCIAGEVWCDGFRADLAAIDETSGEIVGTLEVIDTHEPSEQVLASQEQLAFAYFRYLPKTSSPAGRRSLDYSLDFEMPKDLGKRPKQARGDRSNGAWLCSVECLRWWQQWGGYPRWSPWEAPKCEDCGTYLHDNALSNRDFRSWAYGPEYAYCIHCAARFVAADPAVQWRAPGELAGGDPREWTPTEDADPADLLLAYTEAAFWGMVWQQRVAKLDDLEAYDGSKHQQAEVATEARLLEVTRAFDHGDWRKGANLLLPIGAPGWADYEDEPQRLLAWREDNCRGVANCWSRLLQYRLEQLPKELKDTIRASEPQRQALAEEQVRLREQQRSDYLSEHSKQVETRPQRDQERYEQEKQTWAELQEWFDQRRSNG